MRGFALAIVGWLCTVFSLQADLTEEWSRTAPNVAVVDAKVGAYGDAYIAGTSVSAGSNGILTFKYSPSGFLVWSNHYAGSTGGTHAAAQLLLDGQDYCYVLGQSRGTNVHVGYGHVLDDVVVVKYSPAGQELWVARFSSPHLIDLHPGRMTLDPNGNVYLTVIERDARGYPTIYEGSAYPQFYVVKLGPGGRISVSCRVSVF